MSWYNSSDDLANTLGVGSGPGAKVSQGRKDAATARQGLYDSTTGVLGGMANNDSDYLKTMKSNVDNAKSGYANTNKVYTNNQADLQQQTQDRATDSRKTYTETIQPQMKNMMEDSRKEAGYGPDATSHPMTLAESMDPNNAVHKANEAKYDTQAQNEGRSGLADVGVMQGLGMQNMSTQMQANGVPMTGGQMQAMAGANMNQAGQAFANVQRRQQSLRDQGIAQGYAQSDTAYNRGLDAKDRYNQSVGNYEQADSRQQARDAGYRSEQSGYAGNIKNANMAENSYDFGMNSSMAGATHDLGQQGLARNLANEQQHATGQIEDANSRVKEGLAQKERNANTWSGLMSGGAGMFGKMFGGLGGGSAGSGSSSGGADPNAAPAGTASSGPKADTASDMGVDGSVTSDNTGGAQPAPAAAPADNGSVEPVQSMALTGPGGARQTGGRQYSQPMDQQQASSGYGQGVGAPTNGSGMQEDPYGDDGSQYNRPYYPQTSSSNRYGRGVYG